MKLYLLSLPCPSCFSSFAWDDGICKTVYSAAASWEWEDLCAHRREGEAQEAVNTGAHHSSSIWCRPSTFCPLHKPLHFLCRSYQINHWERQSVPIWLILIRCVEMAALIIYCFYSSYWKPRKPRGKGRIARGLYHCHRCTQERHKQLWLGIGWSLGHGTLGTRQW